jgi:hypothetical protein
MVVPVIGMEAPVIGWIDSLLMAAAMAVAGCPRTYRRQAIFAFAAFDLLASFAGLPFTAWRGAAVVFAFALSFAVIGLARKRPVLFALVPVLCAVDNLFLPVNAASSQLSAALSDGLASGIMASVGFSLGAFLLKRVEGATA